MPFAQNEVGTKRLGFYETCVDFQLRPERCDRAQLQHQCWHRSNRTLSAVLCSCHSVQRLGAGISDVPSNGVQRCYCTGTQSRQQDGFILSHVQTRHF